MLREAKLRAGKPERGLQSAAPLSAAGMNKQEETDWNAAVSSLRAATPLQLSGRRTLRIRAATTVSADSSSAACCRPLNRQAHLLTANYIGSTRAGGNWPKYRRVLETDWQAYLDSKVDFTDAIHAMVADPP